WMKRSTPKRSRCPTLNSPQSTSSATLSMAIGTTRSHLGEELIDLFIYGQLLSWLAIDHNRDGNDPLPGRLGAEGGSNNQQHAHTNPIDGAGLPYHPQ